MFKLVGKMTIFFELGYLLIALASAFDLINFTETILIVKYWHPNFRFLFDKILQLYTGKQAKIQECFQYCS